MRELAPRAAPLCVAFSGGADSTALLAALAAQATLRRRLRAIHVDHGLQPASRAWARHCREVAARLGVPFVLRRVRVNCGPGQSLEAQARAARYAALAQELAAGELLLTAHHQDDQLETVLLQLLRGAGLAGLAAMPAVMPFAAGLLCRPLLSVRRAELTAFTQRRGLPCIEDPANADERFDRNYLRHKVVPLIEARFAGAATAVARSARHAAEAQQLLEQLAAGDAGHCADGARLSAAALRRLTPVRRRNVLRAWIRAAGQLPPDARRLAEIAGPLLAARPDAQPRVEWGEVQVRRHAGQLILEPRVARSLEVARQRPIC